MVVVGLGFDTASEVALLALAALAPKQGIPGALVLILPLVFFLTNTIGKKIAGLLIIAFLLCLISQMFASGMSLVDTLDGIMMMWAYGWAMLHPARKVFYNLVLTMVSAIIALLVGVIEILGCVQQELHELRASSSGNDTNARLSKLEGGMQAILEKLSVIAGERQP